MMRTFDSVKENVVILFAYVVAVAIVLALFGGIAIALIRPDSEVSDDLFAGVAHGVGVVLAALLGMRAGDHALDGRTGTNPGTPVATGGPSVDPQGPSV